ncbi:MAG: lipoprotein-releasing system ATP-binding protein LolD [Candidatus Marinimicrobia bacterium]|nr:lipoprotein-releasing system ATP-binding protein LolD [Candidatus Neomarinimicrobiota bacterium]|tara:strand:- start:168 stop:827 length:660 start_codon:yes stop_codon:yes gene_type:complete
MIIDIKQLTKTFIDGNKKLNVLKDINLQIEEGSIVTIKGPSGSGKSTLLSIIGTLDSADSGEFSINGKKIQDELNIDKLRNKSIGFVFQFHNLIAELTLEENVSLPKMIAKEKIDKNQINKLFDYFDLKDRMKSFPNDLSGGEKQRVAVMRAIINNPSVIIADEPTGNLDKENVLKMISLFQKLNTEKKLTIIIATHDENVFDIGHKKYQLVDGSLEIN